MIDFLAKYYDWIVRKNFNMTERPQDKSNDCSRAINEREWVT